MVLRKISLFGKMQRGRSSSFELLQLDMYGIINIYTSVCSRVLMAPPPTRQTRPPTEPKVIPVPRTPTPAQTPIEQKNKIVTDFLNRVTLGLNKGKLKEVAFRSDDWAT